MSLKQRHMGQVELPHVPLFPGGACGAGKGNSKRAVLQFALGLSDKLNAGKTTFFLVVLDVCRAALPGRMTARVSLR